MLTTCPHCQHNCPDLHTVIYRDAGTYSCVDCLPMLIRQSGRLLDVFIPADHPAAATVVTA